MEERELDRLLDHMKTNLGKQNRMLQETFYTSKITENDSIDRWFKWGPISAVHVI